MKLQVRIAAPWKDIFGQNRYSEIELDPTIEARIIQEEVWAQTGWPEGEVPLATLLKTQLELRDEQRTVDTVRDGTNALAAFIKAEEESEQLITPLGDMTGTEFDGLAREFVDPFPPTLYDDLREELEELLQLSFPKDSSALGSCRSVVRLMTAEYRKLQERLLTH